MIRPTKPIIFLIVFTLGLAVHGLSQPDKDTPMKHEYTNRLSKEKSPYLLQHAHNPVDWYTWGEEAFAKAHQENKPILLSIGYSTCHWCHVMERESFEDPVIAKLMNEYFVPIKVDREERPDIDHLYMTAVTSMTGQGGWPLTVFLTPDKKPFYGGTYFPPEARWGMPGFSQVLTSIHQAWTDRRDQILTSSDSLTQLLKDSAQSETQESLPLDAKVLELGYSQFHANFDGQYGGFGRQPKFPSSHNLSFLLRYSLRVSKSQALEMVNKTLAEMAKGGMYDHLGGGFHRYSTDQEWQVPHFEKMLYDQAMLAKTYLEAYQATQDPRYAQVARDIFDYVLRDMQHSQGGFFSAEDADSVPPEEQDSGANRPEKKEGAFYLWAYDEIVKLLGETDAQVFNYCFGVEKNGNARYDPHAEFSGKNILYVAHNLKDAVAHFKRPEGEIEELITRSRQILLEARAKRPRPHLDDKVLVDWNGLMIASLAFGSRVLDDPRYKEAAVRAADFILKTLVTKDGRLLHRFRDGEAAIPATITDYAFFVHGLLDLYEATFDIKYLKEAERLSREMLRLFWDEKDGGFFLTASDAEELIFRPKELYDGAMPSGNSLAALNLVRLSHLTFQSEWELKVQGLFKAFASELKQRPSAYAQMLIALDFYLGPGKEIVISVVNDKAEAEPFLKETYARFIPNRVIIVRPQGPDAKELFALAPFTKEQAPWQEKVTAYVCENHNCKLPTNDPLEFNRLLDGQKQ